MLNRITSSIDWFIPDPLKTTPYIYKKAKVLTYIHLFLILIISIMTFVATIFFPENGVPLMVGILFFSFLIFIFKKFGNLNISGNLLALAIASILVPTVLETGGLFSDNLLWLIVAPLIALLFANRRSGAFWMFTLIGFTYYNYHIIPLNTQNVFVSQIESLGAEYYAFSYIMLFSAILVIILLFKTGQEQVITLLKDKQLELEEQKSALTKTTEILQEKEIELKNSNQNLEHFAYAASHDLKEPLRMIGTYTKMINKRNQHQLDEISQEYMHFVTDGVKRMQQLLDDLLQYSRLGKSQNQKDTDLNNTLLVVMNNLMMRMQETEATVYCNPLPTIYASSSEMMQLFQNLISNAIKFKAPDVKPVVRIRNVEKDDHYLISLKDNGIGIKKEDQERVFAIFERLHGKTEYEGTGIGLSTVKKIVNNLGGEIWLESTFGAGTTFFFTLPKITSEKAIATQVSIPA